MSQNNQTRFKNLAAFTDDSKIQVAVRNLACQVTVQSKYFLNFNSKGKHDQTHTLGLDELITRSCEGMKTPS